MKDNKETEADIAIEDEGPFDASKPYFTDYQISNAAHNAMQHRRAVFSKLRHKKHLHSRQRGYHRQAGFHSL